MTVQCIDTPSNDIIIPLLLSFSENASQKPETTQGLCPTNTNKLDNK
jgi:hypothetical protein